MNNETSKRDLASRMFEGVKVESTNGIGEKWVGNLNEVTVLQILSTNSKPYLFPTSALTKEIQLANYNNGEPFVPIVEMAKYQYKDVDFEIIDNRCIGRLNVGVVLEFVIEDEIPFYKEFHNNMFGQSVSDSYDDMFRANINPSEITKLFHQWHINYRLSPDQFIEVTEENNPYK